jgi:DNA-binding transcriptional MerR regulator
MTRKKHGISTESINLLKSELYSKLNRTIETHSDCAIVSKELLEKTNRSVGVTTLRRFFGIDASKTLPSMYTLDSLALLCGYKSWDDFSSSKNHLLHNDFGVELLRAVEEINWDLVKKEAHEISQITLKAIKSKSGIPFENTISRHFAQVFLADFINSDKTATAVIAPGGYGKTIMLGRAVEKFWLSDDSEFRDDVVWLIDAGMLKGLQAQKFDFVEWSASQLGLGKNNNYRQYFRDNPEKRKGRMILVIDSVDELLEKRNNDEIFDTLINLLATNDETPWFKIVLSMRNHSWSKFINAHSDYPALKSKWFGVMFEVYNESYTNLQQFSDDEIEELLEKNSSSTENSEVYDTLKEIISGGDFNQFISVPSFFQTLMNLSYGNGKIPSSEVELLAEFIKRNITKGDLGGEKQQIINEILAEMNYGQNVTSIKKKNLIKKGVFKDNSKAYNELLSFGILTEMIRFNKFGTRTTYLKFSDQKLMSFLIISKLSENGISIEFIEDILKSHRNSSHKVDLISWAIKLAFFREDYRTVYSLKKILNTFKYLRHSDRPRFWDEYWQIIRTVGFSLRHDQKARDYLIPKFVAHSDWRHWYFETFVDFDYLMKSFGDNLKFYMRYDSSNTSKIFGESLLLLRSIIEMDFESAAAHVDNLNKYDHDPAFVHPIPLARSLSYQLIYYYQKDGKTNEELLEKILKIEERIHNHYSSYDHIPLFHAIMMLGLNYTKRYDLTVKFGETMHSKYGELVKKLNTPELELSKVLLADGLLEAKQVAEADRYFKSYNPQLFRTTRLTFGIYYYMICSKISLYKGDAEGFIMYARKVARISRKYGFKIYEIMTRERTKSMIERFEKNKG